jgi:predicted lipid-binding transport protein (Tim44 family)
MARSRFLIAGVAALALALSPGLAHARAGSASSFGSRGSMTYSAPPSTRTAPYSAAPMERSMAPRSTPYGGSPMYQGQRSSGFMSGLMGGLIGAGIAGMLFGHGFMGGGFFGFLGMLLQIFLLVMVVRFVFRLVTGGRSPAMAGGPNIFGRGGMPGGSGPFGSGPSGSGPSGSAPSGSAPSGSAPSGSGPSGPPPIAIAPADYQQFEQLLQGIQAAWSAHDLNGLQAMATPEMVSYFADQLSEQVSRGVRNFVTDVRLVSGDLAQAWTEQGRDYATVAMRFSMIDATKDAAGRVVDGSATEHVTATEIWTFVRSRGGHWILSAIQQAR